MCAVVASQRPRAPGDAAPRPAGRSSAPATAPWFLLALAGHVLLARAILAAPGLATLHALAALVWGVGVAAFGRRVALSAIAAAYIVGSEVLWRMTGAPVFWEFGKYAMALILLVAILRRRWSLPVTPFLYFLFLVPSVVLTLSSAGVGEARRALSFNLSGPLTMAIAVWFFSHVTFTRQDVRRLIMALILPVVAIATIVLTSTLGSSSIRFGLSSNFITSGGFGPNQVSAILGLAALLCAFYLLDEGTPSVLKVLMLGGLALFGVQSALTFSRGGLYLAAGAFLAGATRLLAVRRLRHGLIIGAVLVLLAARYVLLPQLDRFTGGTLSQRFRDLDPTGRDRLVVADLQIWWQNPLWGVGPGQAASAREAASEATFGDAPAHTEFSRLLAEHGFFGAAAALMLLRMARRAWRRNRTPPGNALATALLAWSFLYMAVNAMRLAAPALALGMAYAALPRQEPPRRVVPVVHKEEEVSS